MAFPWLAVGSILASVLGGSQATPTGGTILPPIDTSTRVTTGKKPSWLEIGAKAFSPSLGGMFGAGPSGGGFPLFDLISKLAGRGG